MSTSIPVERRGGSVASAGRHMSVAEAPVNSVLPGGDVPLNDSKREWDEQDEALAALGYEPEFKRNFNLFTASSVSFAVLGLLPSFASTLYFGMGYAGTGGMTWGWIIAMIGIQSVASSMAELCSSMPTSGGLYYAAAVLAPPKWGPFASWLTGWSNWMMQITGSPSVNYGTSSMILAAAAIRDPTYSPKNYQIFLLTVLLSLIGGCMASLPTKWIAKVNAVGSTFTFVALIIVLILIPSKTNRTDHGLPRFTSSHEVWSTIYKGTEFPDGVAVLMSFVAVIWTLSGYDAPFHLAEETSNANINSPRAIVLTSAIGGLFGWFLQLVVAYTVVDIPSVLGSDLGQPWAAYLVQCMPENTALAILALTIIAGFFMGQACMIAASRVTFAYARDDVFPLSKYWKRVNKYTTTPVNAVWINVFIGCLLALMILGGPLVAGALFSIGAIAAFVAFTIPIAIRVFITRGNFKQGPWNLGRWSFPIGATACGFVALIVPILCLPSVTGRDLTPALMNWTCLVYGGPMVFVILWWVVDAHKWFKGPKVNIKHRMHSIVGETLEAKTSSSDDSMRKEAIPSANADVKERF